MQQPVALALFCKTPRAGQSKTRLSPPLTPEQCAQLSACFILDVSATIHSVAGDTAAAPYAVFTPAGSEKELSALLPEGFRLLAQSEGDLGERLIAATRTLFAAGHRAIVLINADGPTLPASILRDAIAALGEGDNVTISPAHDGGYNVIGLSQPHDDVFTGIPWSTPAVYKRTRGQALRIGLPIVELPPWYDIDDAEGLRMLEAELAGKPPFAGPLVGAPAHATRAFLAQQRQAGVRLVT